MGGFLLVDDRDGFILAELADPVEALELLEDLCDTHPELADALCLVRFGGRQGSVVRTDTTTRVRTGDVNMYSL